MENDLGGPLDFKYYDSRKNKTMDILTGYRLWSLSYDDKSPIIDLDLLNNSGTIQKQVKDQSIIDLGCGTGRIGRYLKGLCPKFLAGLDVSPEMLKKAEEKGVYDLLIQSDLEKMKPIVRSYYGVISSLVLCHIKSSEKIFHSISDMLTQNGWFGLIDYHPYFLLQGIPTHFKSENQEDIAIVNYVHSFSSIFDQANSAGLKLVEFKERFVTDKMIGQSPSYIKFKGQPISYLMVFRKI